MRLRFEKYNNTGEVGQSFRYDGKPGYFYKVYQGNKLVGFGPQNLINFNRGYVLPGADKKYRVEAENIITGNNDYVVEDVYPQWAFDSSLTEITTAAEFAPIVDPATKAITGTKIINGGSGYTLDAPPVITFPGGYIGKGVLNSEGVVVRVDTLFEGTALNTGGIKIYKSLAKDEDKYRGVIDSGPTIPNSPFELMRYPSGHGIPAPLLTTTNEPFAKDTANELIRNADGTYPATVSGFPPPLGFCPWGATRAGITKIPLDGSGRPIPILGDIAEYPQPWSSMDFGLGIQAPLTTIINYLDTPFVFPESMPAPVGMVDNDIYTFTHSTGKTIQIRAIVSNTNYVTWAHVGSDDFTVAELRVYTNFNDQIVLHDGYEAEFSLEINTSTKTLDPVPPPSLAVENHITWSARFGGTGGELHSMDAFSQWKYSVRSKGVEVFGVDIVDGGSGIVGTPTVVLRDPITGSTLDATATVVVTGGSITEVEVTGLARLEKALIEITMPDGSVISIDPLDYEQGLSEEELYDRYIAANPVDANNILSGSDYLMWIMDRARSFLPGDLMESYHWNWRWSYDNDVWIKPPTWTPITGGNLDLTSGYALVATGSNSSEGDISATTKGRWQYTHSGLAKKPTDKDDLRLAYGLGTYTYEASVMDNSLEELLGADVGGFITTMKVKELSEITNRLLIGKGINNEDTVDVVSLSPLFDNDGKMIRLRIHTFHILTEAEVTSWGGATLREMFERDANRQYGNTGIPVGDGIWQTVWLGNSHAVRKDWKETTNGDAPSEIKTISVPDSVTPPVVPQPIEGMHLPPVVAQVIDSLGMDGDEFKNFVTYITNSSAYSQIVNDANSAFNANDPLVPSGVEVNKIKGFAAREFLIRPILRSIFGDSDHSFINKNNLSISEISKYLNAGGLNINPTMINELLGEDEVTLSTYKGITEVLSSSIVNSLTIFYQGGSNIWTGGLLPLMVVAAGMAGVVSISLAMALYLISIGITGILFGMSKFADASLSDTFDDIKEQILGSSTENTPAYLRGKTYDVSEVFANLAKRDASKLGSRIYFATDGTGYTTTPITLTTAYVHNASGLEVGGDSDPSK